MRSQPTVSGNQIILAEIMSEKRSASKRHIYMMLHVFKIRKNCPCHTCTFAIDSKVAYPKFVNTCKLLNIISSYIYIEQ